MQVKEELHVTLWHAEDAEEGDDARAAVLGAVGAEAVLEVTHVDYEPGGMAAAKVQVCGVAGGMAVGPPQGGSEKEGLCRKDYQRLTGTSGISLLRQSRRVCVVRCSTACARYDLMDPANFSFIGRPQQHCCSYCCCCCCCTPRTQHPPSPLATPAAAAVRA